MSDAVMNFDDLEPVAIPVVVKGKHYTLREASGDAVCKWQNALMRCAKLGPEGKPTDVQNLADVEPYMVSLCLFENTSVSGRNGSVEERESPVDVKTVRSWPARVQKALYQRIMIISDLESPQEKQERLKRENQESVPDNTTPVGPEEHFRATDNGPWGVEDQKLRVGNS